MPRSLQVPISRLMAALMPDAGSVAKQPGCLQRSGFFYVTMMAESGGIYPFALRKIAMFFNLIRTDATLSQQGVSDEDSTLVRGSWERRCNAVGAISRQSY